MDTELNEVVLSARLGGVDLRGSPHSQVCICDIFVYIFFGL